MKFPSFAPVRSINTPVFFADKTSVLADCPLSESEKASLLLAMAAVQMTMEKTPPPVPVTHLNIYFVSSERIDVTFDEPEILGSFFQAIFLPVGLWRRIGYSQVTVVFAMIEELCHAIWLYRDGAQNRQLVEDALRILNPDATYIAFMARALNEQLQPDPPRYMFPVK